MKVTQEMKTKIDRSIREKYEVDLYEMRESLQSKKLARATEMATEIVDLCSKSEALDTYVKNKTCGSVNITTISNYLTGTLRSEYKVEHDEIAELVENMKSEIETVILKVQYGKNMGDVLEVFESYGLKF